MSGERTVPADDLGYEQARDELVLVVQRLESGAGTLEEALALWERGEALAARCQQWLDGARERLEAATARRDSGQGTTSAPGDAPADDENGTTPPRDERRA